MEKIIDNKIITRRPNGTKRVVTVPEGLTRTQQQFKDQCDVNNIIAKFKKTGSITHVRNAQTGVYADLTNLPDLQEAHQIVNSANAAFEAIPASIRQRFGHDPQQFINFLADPSNDDEAIKLGLKTLKTPPPQDPILTELKTLNTTLNTTPKKDK